MITVEAIKHDLPEACQRFRIKYVEAFGSLARNELTEQSDLDLIIELEEPVEEQSSQRFFGFLHFLEDRFGKKIDLLTPRSIKNPYFKQSIEREKIRIYG